MDHLARMNIKHDGAVTVRASTNSKNSPHPWHTVDSSGSRRSLQFLADSARFESVPFCTLRRGLVPGSCDQQMKADGVWSIGWRLAVRNLSLSGTREHVSMHATRNSPCIRSSSAQRHHVEERIQAATGVLEGSTRLWCPGVFNPRTRSFSDAALRKNVTLHTQDMVGHLWQELERMERETLQLRHQIEQVRSLSPSPLALLSHACRPVVQR